MTSRSEHTPAISRRPFGEIQKQDVSIPPRGLPGILCVPQGAQAIVIFAHGSGSSRFSPRNSAVAAALNAQGMATLLLDLLTPEEEADRANVFDIALLAARLGDAVRWSGHRASVGHLPIGLFGASTGAAAALVAAAGLHTEIGAVVSRGGRPDLAGEALARVHAPTLLIVGGADFGVIELNQDAFRQLQCVKALEIVPEATHLFPEPGALEAVTGYAARWFKQHLVPHGHERGRAEGHAV
ncbi:MAG: dienelactone hydrolase family protein [Alphaproteobacteria bacterium]|nr:dienelactone hydrolase family protein [Alphaproteobacteria bacterium]MDE2011501.1 dienelactone hydrolase family protein [Alphaproteobacteria bacterium]MDE2071892.1 dienelactone hydrolase family protein [Alphaproteobacteria bacterium]MDE2350388.1 dienelactone hydrolase family protein [Alphaproteobacteria bacterium]